MEKVKSEPGSVTEAVQEMELGLSRKGLTEKVTFGRNNKKMWEEVCQKETVPGRRNSRC